MGKVKLIVQESYSGQRSPVEVLASVYLSEVSICGKKLPIPYGCGIMKATDNSQDSLCSRKGAENGTNED